MNKRIFIGISVEEKLALDIEEWAKKKFKGLDVRYIKSANMHLTLIPPWYEKDVESVRATLKDIKNLKFVVKLDKVNFGPQKERPRLVWASGKVPKEMLELRSKILIKLKKSPEKRQYLLHLTIARFRQKIFNYFRVKYLDEKVEWLFVVDKFILYESKLSSSGAEYLVLSTFEL